MKVPFSSRLASRRGGGGGVSRRRLARLIFVRLVGRAEGSCAGSFRLAPSGCVPHFACCPKPTRTRIGVLLCCVLVAACSGAKPRIEIARPAPAPAAVERLAAGSTLVVQRPTPGVAPSRSGSTWGRATADPRIGNRHGVLGGAAHGSSARVLPDGTELSLLCDTRARGVEHCLEQLARAFALPVPSAAEAERLRAEVWLGTYAGSRQSAREAACLPALFWRASLEVPDRVRKRS